MNKLVSLEKAVSMIKSGMTIMIGGFLGNGNPKKIIDLILQMPINDLTIIANDTAFPEIGLGKLVVNKQVKKLIVSHIGTNPVTGDLMNAKEIEIEFVPQGTLAERIRCGGAGLGGVLTKTGIGTIIAEGKQVINVNGEDYLLELPLRAEIALIGAFNADKNGNLQYKGTSHNFQPLMAAAADIVIVEADNLLEVGAIEPEYVHTPAIFVDYIVLNE
jgi:acetate CoA/acetoacetate CoA-transferase alpha subunit